MDKKKILIVDDDIHLSGFVKEGLEDSGRYEIEVVNKGSLALQAAQNLKPDLILLDVDIPDKGGPEVAADIQSDPLLRDTPIVFLTGIVSSEEVAAKGGIMGGHPFIAKPATIESIIATVDQNIL